jgi:hypothetical protein
LEAAEERDNKPRRALAAHGRTVASWPAPKRILPFSRPSEQAEDLIYRTMTLRSRPQW